MIAAMAASIALAAVTAAVISAALVWVLARRSVARSAREEVDRVVAELTSRIDELSDELRHVLERAERRERRGELTASIDLDDLLARILEGATALPGVATAVVSLDGGEEGRIVAATGIPLAQAREETLAGPPRRAGEPRSRLAEPLAGELGELGFVAVYSSSPRELESEIGADLRELAGRAGPAVDNALRYREARRLADLDALTGLHNRRYFHETLQRECARAQRYGRRLALLVLDVDDFKAINERLGHLAGDGVLAEAAVRVRSVLRASDIASRVGGDEFAIILPEGGAGDAEQLYHRVERVVSRRPIGRIERLSVSAGVTELREDDDARTFFERADDALYGAKNAGKGRVLPDVEEDEPKESSGRT
jgi:diguanylate cyclase (GGDEF)-like protein